MVADQLVDDGAGGTETVKGVGRLRFVLSPDHDHRHLIHLTATSSAGLAAPARSSATARPASA